jgi:hypothetical protein
MLTNETGGNLCRRYGKYTGSHTYTAVYLDLHWPHDVTEMIRDRFTLILE